MGEIITVSCIIGILIVGVTGYIIATEIDRHRASRLYKEQWDKRFSDMEKSRKDNETKQVGLDASSSIKALRELNLIEPSYLYMIFGGLHDYSPTQKLLDLNIFLESDEFKRIVKEEKIKNENARHKSNIAKIKED